MSYSLDKDLNSDLKFACAFGHLEQLQSLLEKGADIRCDNDYPFVFSCYNGRLNIVKHLLPILEKDPSFDIQKYSSILFNLIEYGRTDTLEYLVTETRLKDVFDVNADNGAALIEACDHNFYDMIKLLLQLGADVHVRDEAALIKIVEHGDGCLKTLKLLVEQGADVSFNHYYPLQLAAKIDNLDATLYFLKLGADINVAKQFGTPRIQSILLHHSLDEKLVTKEELHKHKI